MPDFRDPTALKGETDGTLYYIINKGKGEMEGEGARVKPDDTWNLVNYVRSFSKLQAATAAHGTVVDSSIPSRRPEPGRAEA